MKRALCLAMVTLVLVPSSADAARWNPFTWKILKPKAESLRATTTGDGAPLSQPAVLTPTVEELYRRIAELEDKLDKALSKKKEETKPEPKSASKPLAKPEAASINSGLSDKEILAKAGRSVIAVEVAGGRAGGALIDSSGHLVVAASAVFRFDAANAAVGVAPEVSIILSNGEGNKAKLVGFDEASDIAVYRVLDADSLPYIKVSHDAGIKSGDRAYILGPRSGSDAGAGNVFAPGTVTSKSSNKVELTTNTKPSDRGVMVNARGEFVGLSGKAVCKILEEMETCLAYKASAGIIRGPLSKVIEGMKLFKDKKNSTREEVLIGTRLEGYFGSVKNNSNFEYTISSVTGQNSFDYFNSKLGSDQKGKFTKLYLSKLKAAAENMYKAMDQLKGLSEDLNVFLINESNSIDALDDYQRKIVRKIESENAQKVKEYQDKVGFWSKKKNEYDSYISKPTEASHDYLMEQGLFIEESVEYLEGERKWVFETFSKDITDLF